jgi:hypothetical protein
MPRGSKKTTQKCAAHEFSLRPCSEHVRHPHNLSLSYCAHQGTGRGGPGASKTGCLQAPIFNRDQSHASPAFVLPTDKVFPSTTQDYYGMRRGEMLEEHELRFLNFTDEKSELVSMISLSMCLNRDQKTISAMSAAHTTRIILR